LCPSFSSIHLEKRGVCQRGSKHFRANMRLLRH
jgi:hypothetical protein